MFVIYHRVGRIPVRPALAAAGALIIVGGIAVTILAIVGVVACGEAASRVRIRFNRKRRLPFQGADTVDGVAATRSLAGMLGR